MPQPRLKPPTPRKPRTTPALAARGQKRAIARVRETLMGPARMDFQAPAERTYQNLAMSAMQIYIPSLPDSMQMHPEHLSFSSITFPGFAPLGAQPAMAMFLPAIPLTQPQP